MKKLAVLLLLGIALTLLFVFPAAAGQGNGAPSGQHFTLNIIGVDNPKTAPMDDSNRHTIFVPLDGICGIGLTKGDDFKVLDGNCFSKGITVPDSTLAYNLNAGFQLPHPDPLATGTLQYTVFVKVTSPKGQANMQTCFYDTNMAETYCNTGMMLDLTKANYPKFTNVSKNLLTVCASLDGGVTWKLQPLFFQANTQYWWEYDNNGLRHAQFRFYPNVPDNTPYVNTLCTKTTR